MTDSKYKVLLLGDMAVGKTSFLVQFCDGKYETGSLSTIGVDFKNKYVKHEDQDIKLEIWDTAGQERFKSITKKYYRGSDGIVLFYDITKKNTFNNLKSWANSIKEVVGNNEMSIIIVGNKCDMIADREVSEEEGKKYAEQANMLWMEASGKQNINVSEVFICLLEKMTINGPKAKKNSKLNNKANNNKKGCC